MMRITCEARNWLLISRNLFSARINLSAALMVGFIMLANAYVSLETVLKQNGMDLQIKYPDILTIHS